MKLIKKITSYNFAVLFASLAFVTAGLLIYSSHKAEAATQSYSETYNVTKWMNCSMYLGTAWKTSVGPAEWAVSGSVGSTTFTETWVASDWKRTGLAKGSSTSYPCVAEGSFLAGMNTTFFNSGMYGITFTSNAHGVSTGGSILPGKWTITGRINTP